MLYLWLTILTCIGVVVASLVFMQSSAGRALQESTYDHSTTYITYRRPLEVGERIELFGGLGNDPLFLKSPSSHARHATVLKFIRGERRELAAVAKLDLQISGEIVTGYYVLLQLCHNEQTWKEPSPVEIMLYSFEPQYNIEEEQEHGEYIEAAASLIITSRLAKGAKLS